LRIVIGKAVMLNCTDVTIIATGHLVWEALIAAEIRRKRYFAEVINIHNN
jgi:transketolase